MKGKKHRTTFIRIQAGGVVDEIDAQHLEPSHWMLFVVSNEDTSNAPHKYTLSFDPQADIVNKETRTVVKNLLTTTALQKVALMPGEVDTIRVQFQPKGSFGNGNTFPYTTYKYTLHLKDDTSGTTVDIDPDFDIAPPN